jgi:hypothetical protein
MLGVMDADERRTQLTDSHGFEIRARRDQEPVGGTRNGVVERSRGSRHRDGACHRQTGRAGRHG